MAENNVVRPPFDPAYRLAGGIPQLAYPFDYQALRNASLNLATAAAICENNPHIQHTDHTVPALQGVTEASTLLALFEHKTRTAERRAVIYFVHGGGQLVGDRFGGPESYIRMFREEPDMVVASIEHRLAPEHPAPAGAHDCYAGLVYLVENAEKLHIDPAKIIICGVSGGAAIAAAAILLARRRKTPLACAQMLSIPMIDDRDDWASGEQFRTNTLWEGRVNQQAWDLVLGSDRKDGAIDEVRCAGRASDLSGLPPTFIDVGSCEVFRDSAVEFASRIWKAGGIAELHVWPGMYHGAVAMEPHVPVSQAQIAAQKSYIQRILRQVAPKPNEESEVKPSSL